MNQDSANSSYLKQTRAGGMSAPENEWPPMSNITDLPDHAGVPGAVTNLPDRSIVSSALYPSLSAVGLYAAIPVQFSTQKKTVRFSDCVHHWDCCKTFCEGCSVRNWYP
jgi:hypothetical protein